MYVGAIRRQLDPGSQWKLTLGAILTRWAGVTVISIPCSFGHPRNPLNIERTRVGDKVVLRLDGRMDAENASQFEQQCQSCIAEGFTKLVIDLGDLKYVSSLGLRSFVVVAKKLREKGGDLSLCRLTGLVRQVFEITRLDQVLPPHDSVESALTEG